VRLRAPSAVTGQHWLVDDIAARRRFKVEPSMACLLLAASTPATMEELTATLRRHFDIERSACLRKLAAARNRRLLVEPAQIERDPHLRWLVSLRRAWNRYGWDEAAEYHAATFDYPGLDYSRDGGGYQHDRERMRRYNREQVDLERRKHRVETEQVVPLPTPSAGMVDVSLSELWGGQRRGVGVTAESASTVLSLTFGEIDSIRTRRPTVPSFVRRTSPSGGARHPSEGYAVVRSVEGMPAGIYHVCTEPLSLRRIGVLPDDGALTRAFRASVARAPFEVALVIVVTSAFERNMYRYREPRTFRVVNMDAGHLIGTAGLVAGALGLRIFVEYVDDDEAVEALLGIDGLREGYMASAAIGPAG
jgi:SagB-type dehydrogenase family enzyme